jgi:hypothetical protein
MVQPAMADPDLEGAIQDGFCPGAGTGFVVVLGITVAIPDGTPITTDGGKPVDCTKLVEGDRIKVGCTAANCSTAAYVKFEANSTESSVSFEIDCSGNKLGFALQNDVACLVNPATEVKQDTKKNFLGLPVTKPPTQPTVTDLFNFLCAGSTIPGTTPGTLEVKCSGYNAGGGNVDATKVEVKK